MTFLPTTEQIFGQGTSILHHVWHRRKFWWWCGRRVVHVSRTTCSLLYRPFWFGEQAFLLWAGRFLRFIWIVSRRGCSKKDKTKILTCNYSITTKTIWMPIYLENLINYLLLFIGDTEFVHLSLLECLFNAWCCGLTVSIADVFWVSVIAVGKWRAKWSRQCRKGTGTDSRWRCLKPVSASITC